jgi:SAM-dependent methyltransferase
MADLFREHLHLLCCPACRGDLNIHDESLHCNGCGNVFVTENGIPLLFHPHDPGDKRDVTDIVKAFYEETPFPNYDDVETRDSLRQKAQRGLFARMLDEQLPPGAIVLEAGCGTGQLSNFLGMSWNRRVFGSDICLNSLRLAKWFRDRAGILNARFVQMNLFRPAFREEAFDVVISNGVLMTTGDPVGGFRSITRLVKPGGFILVGLYNTIGRLTTDLRRVIFNITGDRFQFLDAHMRNAKYNDRRKRAWFMDQYKHPHECKHSYDEVLTDWFEPNGIEFLSSIPKIGPAPFSPDEQLFAQHPAGSKMSRFLTQLDMLMGGGVDGGLFIMIGRKKGTISQSSGAETAFREAGHCASSQSVRSR